MWLTRFDPFKELQELEKRMNEAFAGPTVPSSDILPAFAPSVNTREGEYAYHIDVDLPGVRKEDIHVDVKNGTLTVSGERKTKSEVKKEDYYKMESSFGRFSRSFTLPANVDAENINAACNDGVLEVTIPKKGQTEGAKKIEVK